ncbi:DNA methyltransferase [Undibacterium sp. KW1]|uniref:DNA cytosine methyltransferase n=1 Tax=Undibacterium sp. KW1 TaxID=2058624 RepID=UPI001331F225|nr:DNA methyltransferase [Undibacterium sp. KW1]
MKRDQYTIPLGFCHELIVDNFAGGGGASEGIEQAFGRAVDIAINHDGEALAMHEANHPTTAHYREDVFAIHPGFVTAQQPIGLAWFSPDCKHHSKAKGGKPREKGIRGLAWVTLKWAALQMPRCIALENVEEFRDWGPLDDEGKPIKAEKGRTFAAFIDALSTGVAKDHPDVEEIYEALGADFPVERLHAGLGYKVEHRIMRACDYGTPTIRKRLFVFARRDGLPIVWPDATHGDPKTDAVKAGKLLPWRTAAQCIDWSIPCPSIFERKRPLKDATLRRIAKGIMKFVVQSADPFIVKFSENSVGQETDSPLHTVMAGAPRFGMVEPVIINVANSKTTGRGPNAWDINDPLRTVTSSPGFSVVQATVAPFITEHANASTQRNFAADEPLRTQCAQVKGGHFAAVSVTLAHGEESPSGAKRWGSGVREVTQPMQTVLASGNGAAIVSAMLAKHYGGVVGTSVEVPFGTVTTADHHSVVTANLVREFGNSAGADVDAPVGTITAGGSGKTQLIASSLVKLRGTNTGQPTDEPLHTISAGGTHHGEVRAFLVKYYGEGGQWQDVREPMHTVPCKDRLGLVTIKGEDTPLSISACAC